MEPEYLSIRASARYLGCNPATVYRLIKAGTLTVYRNGITRHRPLLLRSALDTLKELRPDNPNN